MPLCLFLEKAPRARRGQTTAIWLVFPEDLEEAAEALTQK